MGACMHVRMCQAWQTTSSVSTTVALLYDVCMEEHTCAVKLSCGIKQKTSVKDECSGGKDGVLLALLRMQCWRAPVLPPQRAETVPFPAGPFPTQDHRAVVAAPVPTQAPPGRSWAGYFDHVQSPLWWGVLLEENAVGLFSNSELN